MMVQETQEKVDFKLILAQRIYLLKAKKAPPGDFEKVLEEVTSKNLAPIYEHICSELGHPVDQAKLTGMKEAISEKVKELDDKIVDAQENLGETDVRDALLDKANYYGDLGSREEAKEAYAKVEQQTAGSGLKMDLVFSQMRLEILYTNWKEYKKLVARAKQLCEEGGDWERKNRLKVYEAIFCLAVRDFKRASELFLESIATFTTTELMEYEKCIMYAIVTCMISLDRVQLKKKVIDSPEILSVIDALPHMQPFLNSLYSCNYKLFFEQFVPVIELMQADTYMHQHVRYYMREMRVVVYSQFLDAYKSVTIEQMAAAFGVSADFLDKQLSGFIVLGRLSAKIDKVAGVVETKRPDSKNALYQSVIKQGDALLNRVQKLSKVIDIE